MSASRAVVLEPPRQGQQRKVPRGRRWLIIIGISFVVLAGIGLFIFTWHFPFSRERVKQSLEETFHGQVAFAKFHRTYFPHPGCVAEGVTLVHPSGPPGSPPLVSAQKFTVQAHYIYLLFRPGFVSRIVLEGLHIQVPSRSSGRSVNQRETPSNTRVGEVVANHALLEIAREHGKEPSR